MKNVFAFMLVIFISLNHIDASTHSVKAVIFDCDGTLVDTEKVLCEAWKFAFQKQGYDLVEKEYWNLLNQNSIAGLPAANLILAELGCEMLNKECKDDLLKDVEIYMEDVKKKGFPPIEATLTFLCLLANSKHNLNIKIGLASGNNKKNILSHLKDLGVENHFDVILSGSEDLSDYQDDEGTNKPKPYIYLQAAKLLGVLPSECVAIEDSRTGVTSAVNAGCITIAVPNVATAQHDLSHAHLKIESFSEINIELFFELIKNIGSTSNHAPT